MCSAESFNYSCRTQVCTFMTIVATRLRYGEYSVLRTSTGVLHKSGPILHTKVCTPCEVLHTVPPMNIHSTEYRVTDECLIRYFVHGVDSFAPLSCPHKSLVLSDFSVLQGCHCSLFRTLVEGAAQMTSKLSLNN